MCKKSAVMAHLTQHIKIKYTYIRILIGVNIGSLMIVTKYMSFIDFGEIIIDANKQQKPELKYGTVLILLYNWFVL